MPSTAKLFLVIGAASAALAVILGAFGAHAVRERLPADLMQVYRTAEQYHLWHSLGLLAVGLVSWHLPESTWLNVSGWLMIAGIVLFSGSLYVLAVSGLRWLGAVTPFGGLAFILAWIALTIAIWRG